jgi:hypothetical protein
MNNILFQFLLNKSTDDIKFQVKQLPMNSNLFIHLYKFQRNCKFDICLTVPHRYK